MTHILSALHRLDCRARLSASVLLLHGYGASAAVNLGDGEAFVGEHTEVLLPDAPGHGRRADGRLEHIRALVDEQRAAAIWELAREWTGELEAVVADCRARGASRFGLVGISMGGYAALAAVAQPCPFHAVASVLAAPILVDRSRLRPGDPPLLIGIAGRDSSVPPEPARRFAEDYGAELHAYPHSEHLMRAEDWEALWQATAAFLRRELAP